MELKAFLSELYLVVDDWYKQYIAPQIHKHAGAKPKLSDSELLTIAIAGQWRVGVPWQSERGVVRWVQEYGRDLFPNMIGRSAFNERVRWLWGAFIQLQQVVGELLSSVEDVYESVDSVPLVAYSNAQGQREAGHWLWESQVGHGGTHGEFYIGDKVLTSVTAQGVVTGWVVGNANLNDRWLMQALLSARAGQAQLLAPPDNTHQSRAKRPSLPVGHIGALQAAGAAKPRPYLADQAFNSPRWRAHWQQQYGATVISLPAAHSHERAAWTRSDARWLASHRQIVDTTFAFLTTVFGWQRMRAHSRWGHYTRIAITFAAYHIGMYFNRLLGRPLHALETLIG